MDSLVSAEWLNDHLSDDDLVVLDATMPTLVEAPDRIPGSIAFDIKHRFSNSDSPYPNTFPDTPQFEKECRELGINSNSKIVIYDSKGIYTSPRVWWMFKTFGHHQVAILDGGLPGWLESGFPTVEGYSVPSKNGNFEATLDKTQVKDFSFIQENSNSSVAQVIDARSNGRFNGTDPEPRKELQSGCIPNSSNIFYGDVLENGYLKSQSELLEIFRELEAKEQPLVFSCGSGITACIILFAYRQVGQLPTAVFDGSWTEWAIRNELFTSTD